MNAPSMNALNMRARNLWRRSEVERIKRFVGRVRAVFPFTGAGVLIVAGCAVSLVYYGLGKIDLILLGVGAVGLGVAALSLITTTIAAVITYVRLKKRHSRDPLRLECGYWAPTGFSLPSLWYIPFVQIAWCWSAPEAKARAVKRDGRMIEEIRPERRDTHDRLERRFDIGDIFGLCNITLRMEEERSILFLPWVGNLRQMHVLRGMAGGEELSHPEGPPEGDRIDMRRYVAGDPIRFVLWKVFAKTRDLVVRTPETAISPSRRTIAYLVAHQDDEPAAGAVRVAVDVGAFGGEWTLGADGARDVAETRDEALELLARSARAAEEESGAGLGSFLKHAPRGRVGRAVVFVPPRPGPWLDKVIASALSEKKAGEFEFVVGCDGIIHPPRSFLGRLVYGKPKMQSGVASIAELSEVVQRLTAARLRVLVVDRASGQIYTPDHLALKAA
jgi:hypothetical protein